VLIRITFAHSSAIFLCTGTFYGKQMPITELGLYCTESDQSSPRPRSIRSVHRSHATSVYTLCSGTVHTTLLLFFFICGLLSPRHTSHQSLLCLFVVGLLYNNSTSYTTNPQISSTNQTTVVWDSISYATNIDNFRLNSPPR